MNRISRWVMMVSILNLDVNRRKKWCGSEILIVRRVLAVFLGEAGDAT